MHQPSEKQTFFTIATVTKDNAAGLQKTYNSIKNQSFTDFEWLVQDGASTDETTQFLSQTNAITTSQPDNGIYDAMNRLIERANGHYILFLNAGDALAGPNILEIIHAAASKETPDFIYGDAHEGTGTHTKPKTSKPHTHITRGMFTHHQSMLYRRAAIGSLRYNTHYKIAADYDFTAQFLQESQRALYVPAPICIFEAGGISQQNAAHGRREQFKIRENLKLCAPALNHVITSAQALNWQLRKLAPPFYWFLKGR